VESRPRAPSCHPPMDRAQDHGIGMRGDAERDQHHGNCQTCSSKPLSWHKRRTIASARRRRPSRSASIQAGWFSQSQTGVCEAASATTRLMPASPLMRLPARSWIPASAKPFFEHQNGTIAARVALHADASDGSQPALFEPLDRCSLLAAQAADGQARPGEGMAVRADRRSGRARGPTRAPRPCKAGAAVR